MTTMSSSLGVASPANTALRVWRHADCASPSSSESCSAASARRGVYPVGAAAAPGRGGTARARLRKRPRLRFGPRSRGVTSWFPTNPVRVGRGGWRPGASICCGARVRHSGAVAGFRILIDPACPGFSFRDRALRCTARLNPRCPCPSRRAWPPGDFQGGRRSQLRLSARSSRAWIRAASTKSPRGQSQVDWRPGGQRPVRVDDDTRRS